MILVRKIDGAWQRLAGTIALTSQATTYVARFQDGREEVRDCDPYPVETAPVDAAKVEQLVNEGVWGEDELTRYGLVAVERFAPPEGKRVTGEALCRAQGKVWRSMTWRTSPPAPAADSRGKAGERRADQTESGAAPMTGLPPPILPDHYVAKRPAIIRAHEGDVDGLRAMDLSADQGHTAGHGAGGGRGQSIAAIRGLNRERPAFRLYIFQRSLGAVAGRGRHSSRSCPRQQRRPELCQSRAGGAICWREILDRRDTSLASCLRLLAIWGRWKCQRRPAAPWRGRHRDIGGRLPDIAAATTPTAPMVRGPVRHPAPWISRLAVGDCRGGG